MWVMWVYLDQRQWWGRWEGGLEAFCWLAHHSRTPTREAGGPAVEGSAARSVSGQWATQAWHRSWVLGAMGSSQQTPQGDMRGGGQPGLVFSMVQWRPRPATVWALHHQGEAEGHPTGTGLWRPREAVVLKETAQRGHETPEATTQQARWGLSLVSAPHPEALGALWAGTMGRGVSETWLGMLPAPV